MTNHVIYLGNVSSQNPGTDGLGVMNEWQYGASLTSRHWILYHAPLFGGKWENAAKM